MAFVCGECVRKGKEERDSPVGFLISMAVGADSLRESSEKPRERSPGCPVAVLLHDAKDTGV